MATRLSGVFHMSPVAQTSPSPLVQQPLVSVCIPAYRAREFLSETLISVGRQTYPHWEIVLTEDGSADGAQEIAEAFARTVSQRVVYLRHKQNRGLAATRNTSIAVAHGSWVAFLDADDVWEPTHLAELVAMALAHPDANVVCSAAMSFDSLTGQPLEPYPQHAAQVSAFPVSLYQGELIILPSAAMVSRKTFQELGVVNERYRTCNDTELWFRFASKGARFAFTRQATLRYRRHARSMSRRQRENLLDLARLYGEYANWKEIPFLMRKRKAASLYRYAGKVVHQTNPRAARALFIASLHRCIWELPTWYFLLRSFLITLRPHRTAELTVEKKLAT